MKYFLVAGEASGDLHGANLIRGILKADPGAEFRCWGGDKMHEAGAQLLMHYRAHAIMG
ncbi:MAG TPA: lipid-A-disaccharide synthase, partial [Bacteroidales bacterium]|nr:lipid-A-disaccharide synthase [Bacteroidales bacterium]